MPSAISAIRPPPSAPFRITPNVAGYGHTSTANATTPIGTTHESTRRTVASGIRRSASAFTIAFPSLRFPLSFGVLPPGRPRPNPKQCRAGAGRGRDRTGSRGSPRDERHDHGRELGPAILLEEVAAALDGRVRLPGRARDGRLHRPVAAAGDRVLVGERAEERAVEATEHLPRG